MKLVIHSGCMDDIRTERDGDAPDLSALYTSSTIRDRGAYSMLKTVCSMQILAQKPQGGPPDVITI